MTREGTARTSPSPEQREGGWLKYTALTTGVLAVVAGILTVRGTNLANDAIFHSNQAVLFQAQASDAWAEYQADSIKARVVETTLTGGVTDPAARDQLTRQATGFRDRQPPLREKAAGLEQRRDAELTHSTQRLVDKDTLSYAGVAVQLGIGLASIAALTRRRAALVAGVLAGVAGVAIAASTVLASRG